MTRISGTDHILLRLKVELEKASLMRKASAPAKSGRSGDARSGKVRLAEILRTPNVTDEEKHKALVRILLHDAFGDIVDTDPKMQSIIDEVVRQMRETDETRNLLDQALGQLASGE